MRRKKQEIEVDNAIVDTITPTGIEFFMNGTIIGEKIGKIVGITKYPQKATVGWLSKITNISNSVVVVSVNPVENNILIDLLNRIAKANKIKGQLAKDMSTRQLAETSEQHSEQLMNEIHENNESVVAVSTLVYTYGNEKDEAELSEKKVKSITGALGCRIRGIAGMQENYFKFISPTYFLNPLVRRVCDRVMPLSTLIGGQPFTNNGFVDKVGNFIGITKDKQFILLDIWTKIRDRTNSNMVILGGSGVGKSATAKDFIISEYARGVKIIYLDPEAECVDMELSEGEKPDVINCGGSELGRINPLHIRPVPKDDEDTDVDKGLMDLASHMRNIEVFFRLYNSSITDRELSTLNDCVIETYKKFGIEWETDTTNYKTTDFPIISDLYYTIEEFYNKYTEPTHKEIYSELLILLSNIHKGSDQFLWNGHTTLQSNSKFIVLNTHALNDAGDNIKRAQYYNILSWAWNEMTKDRNERVMLVADEAYLMIDENVPQAMVFLRNAMKRARKYEASVCVISQNVIDFMSQKVKMYASPLLTIPTYKILMGTDGEDLAELKKLYKLTEYETELLEMKQRGTALVMAGNKRFEVNIKLKHKKRHGKGGGN